MTTTLVDEITELIELVEAGIPANPNAPKNRRHATLLELALRRYFKGLDQAFPYHRLDELYYRHVEQESLAGIGKAIRLFEQHYSYDEETGDLLDPILRAFRARILTDLTGQHARIYLSGSAEMIRWGRTLGGKPILYEGPPNTEAIQYAERHCAELVTNMDQETKQQIAKVISDGIKNKRGVDGLARDLRRQFMDMASKRSRVIARTETSDALSQAFMDRSEDMGVDGKEIVTGDPCEICAANAAEGVVPIAHIFQSGHSRPPFHPNCVCGLAPVMLSRQ